MEQLRILSDALGDGCRWVVVKNEAHSDTSSSTKSSKTRRHLSTRCTRREITMPRLYDWLVTALNEHNVTDHRGAHASRVSTCSTASD